METVINLRLSVTFVLTVMFVRPLVRVTIQCLQHPVQQGNGADLEYPKTLMPLFVRLDISVQSVLRNKYLVLLANTIQVLEQHNILVQLVRQEITANSGILCPPDKLHKNLHVLLAAIVRTPVLMQVFLRQRETIKIKLASKHKSNVQLASIVR